MGEEDPHLWVMMQMMVHGSHLIYNYRGVFGVDLEEEVDLGEEEGINLS